MSKRKDVRNVEDYWEKRGSVERVRPYVILHWKDHDGRWRFKVRAGNNVITTDSEKEDGPDSYATRFWALRKAKQTLPRGVNYVVEQINSPT